MKFAAEADLFLGLAQRGISSGGKRQSHRSCRRETRSGRRESLRCAERWVSQQRSVADGPPPEPTPPAGADRLLVRPGSAACGRCPGRRWRERGSDRSGLRECRRKRKPRTGPSEKFRRADRRGIIPQHRLVQNTPLTCSASAHREEFACRCDPEHWTTIDHPLLAPCQPGS